MNIFYLDHSPYVAAMWHGDKHVSKMLIETAQMLSTAHHVLLGEKANNLGLYKPTHINHPCNKWVRENSANYRWAFKLLEGLCYEFHIRRRKIHKTQNLLPILEKSPFITQVSKRTPPALAMPDEYKSDNPVLSYRRYYQRKFKEGIVTYNWCEIRNKPWWIRNKI